MDKKITIVDGIKYKNLSEEDVRNLKTTAKLGETQELREKARQTLNQSQSISPVKQLEHDAGSFKAATGKFATTSDIPTNENFTKKTYDYSTEVLGEAKPSNTVRRVMSGASKAGRRLPVIGGLMAAAGSGDLMAAVPVLGSADEVGKGSDVSAKSKEEKLAMEKEARMRMAKQIEESKRKKPTQNVFDIIKEKLKK